MSSVADSFLEIAPDTELQFTLTATDATPKCTLELKHPDPSAQPIAFKVKTTQPRRYLVRPNQGLLEPGAQQSVQILLVEKDKTSLLQSYHRLGQSALDHSKDKFLVQSVAVDGSRASKLKDYDELTAFWQTVSTSQPAPGMSAVAHKKLHVRHMVPSNSSGGIDGVGGVIPSTGADAIPQKSIDEMSQDQLKVEITNLRRKYDELVSFSVNLTAERDILNNTLEQTKRDLNRELQKSAASDNHRRTTSSSSGTVSHSSTSGSGGGGGGGGSSVLNFIILLVVAAGCVLGGIRLEQMSLGADILIKTIPALKPYFAVPSSSSSSSSLPPKKRARGNGNNGNPVRSDGNSDTTEQEL